MSITLANKYRPTTFDDVVEQGAIKQILQEQLKTNSHKNCYLFTGGAGTGKTTCARIFANEINQHKGNPIEVDAASNNGVENIRDIIDNAKFKALDSEYKVYIIDECHMLSNGAWNAMLKLLEEPPAKTIFVMCTTDPQKIPGTILSRVQRYDFQRITFESIVGRLVYICEQEQVDADKDALEYIAKLADGGCRDSITLLDKCISFNPKVTIESVVEALGTVDYQTMFQLTAAIVTKDSAKVITTIEEIHRKGVDLKQFVKQYSYFLLDVYKYQVLGEFTYLQIPILYRTQLLELKNNECIHKLLDKCVHLNTDIKWETTPKPLIQTTFVLMSLEV